MSFTRTWNSDVLLTVLLSIFVLVINQLEAQNLFYNKKGTVSIYINVNRCSTFLISLITG